MKEKQLLRLYDFRMYLEYLGTNRREFKKMNSDDKRDILIGYAGATGKDILTK